MTALRMSLVFVLGSLAGCGDRGAPDDDTHAVRAPAIVGVAPGGEAIAGAEVAKLDPATMNDAEIEKALGTGARCEFRYTSTGRPVLAIKPLTDGAAGEGVVKLNGHLVMLTPRPGEGALRLGADGISFTLMPPVQDAHEGADGGLRQADAVFGIGSSLSAGYRGYYRCNE